MNQFIEKHFNSMTGKKERARKIAKEDEATSGLICVLDSVGSITSTRTQHRNAWSFAWDTPICLHHYFYFLEPKLGLMHAC